MYEHQRTKDLFNLRCKSAKLSRLSGAPEAEAEGGAAPALREPIWEPVWASAAAASAEVCGVPLLVRIERGVSGGIG